MFPRFPSAPGLFLFSVCLPGLLTGQSPAADAKQRIRVVHELEKKGGSTTIPELAGYLKDPDTEVRVEAVKAIVGIGTQHSLDALVAATADNDAEIQIRATDGLVNFYYPGYIQTGMTASLKRVGNSIKAKFTDTNDQVVDAYVIARPDVIEALGKLTRGGVSLEVRSNAARAVGILRGRAALPDLLEAVRTKDTQVIYEVLVALQKINAPEAMPQITFLLRDLNEKVQLAALETSGLLRNKEVLPDLRDALGRAHSTRVKEAALTAIARLADESSRDLFERYFADKDEDLRAPAAEGLGRLKNPQDLPKLEQAFEEEKKMSARLGQAFALVQLGKHDTSEFSPLRYLVNTLNSAFYRGVAAAYLAESARDQDVRQKLYANLNERTKAEKLQLATVFSRTGEADAVPVLETLSRDGDLEVAQEGTRALRTLRARLPQ